MFEYRALKASIGYTNYNYGYNSLVVLNNEIITNRLKGDVITFTGGYENKIGALDFKGNLGVNLSGDLEGNFINGDVSYSFSDDIDVQVGACINSKAPDFNFQLNQSDYLSYNWQNSFKNQQTKQLAFIINSKKLGTIELDYNSIGN